MFDKTICVAMLKAKAGETTGLQKLDRNIRDLVLPAFDIVRSSKGTLDDHLAKSIDKIAACCSDGEEFLLDIFDLPLDLRTERGAHPLIAAATLCVDRGIRPMLSLGLDRDAPYLRALAAAMKVTEAEGIAVRLQLHDLVFWESAQSDLNRILTKLDLDPSQVFVILDLRTIDQRLLDRSESHLHATLAELSRQKWGGVAIASSSMIDPTIMPTQSSMTVPRLEMGVWRNLRIRFPFLRYGDYGPIRPDYVDPTGIVIPAAKIRYCTDHAWNFSKGLQPGRSKIKQTRLLARNLIASPEYRAADTSWGNLYVKRCASGELLGRPVDWVAVDVNIHLDFTVRQLRRALAPVPAIQLAALRPPPRLPS